MIDINWEEFKAFKEYRHKKDDNFEILLDFLKSYYNMTNPTEIYDTLLNDEIAPMMLEKRGMHCVTDLEEHLFKHFNESK